MNWMGTRPGTTAVITAPTGVRPPRAARSWFSRSRNTTAPTASTPVTASIGAGSALTDPATLAAVAEEAVASFRSQVIGRRLHSGVLAGTKVRVVVSSAAVTSDPSRLEVWVLLGDIDEEQVPPRWDPTEVEADPDLTAWARTLRGSAIGHFVSLDWPFAELVTVRFDVADRVERRGGWRYVAA